MVCEQTSKVILWDVSVLLDAKGDPVGDVTFRNTQNAHLFLFLRRRAKKRKEQHPVFGELPACSQPLTSESFKSGLTQSELIIWKKCKLLADPERLADNASPVTRSDLSPFRGLV